MKVEPKEGIDKPRVKHNKVLFWIVIVLIILFIVLIIYMMNNWEEWENKEGTPYKPPDTANECTTDSDCVKDECCHASGCVSIENAPDCGELFCTTECAPGTLDCGQGECKCVEGKCEGIFFE